MSRACDSGLSETSQTPVTICWHCDMPLDAATGMSGPGKPDQGSISLCLYCGAVAVFGAELQLLPPTEQLLDDLIEDREFQVNYVRFSWARQYVMIKESLLRDRTDPDR